MELVLDSIVTAVGVGVVGQYTWSGKAHFSSEKMPLGSILISVTVLIAGILYLYLAWAVIQPLAAQLAGLLLMVFGGTMFWLAVAASREARLHLAFDENKPHGLVSVGPYKYVRHPFYTSYVIFWTGFAIATWSLTAVVPLIILIVIYVVAARTEEQKFANSSLAAEYAAYKGRTGFFWPKLG